jgi:hypothetical protein
MAPRSVVWMLAFAVVAGREGSAEDRWHGWDGRVYLTIDGGYQPARGAFAYGDSQTVFQEKATAQAKVTPRGAAAIDAGGGVRLFGPVGIGATLSTVHATQSTSLTINVPHPLLFRHDATATAVDSRSRRETALHLHAILMTAMGRKLRLGLFGGPSRFWVQQPLAADVELEPTFNPEDLSFVIALPTVLYKTARGSAWGFHAGADLAVRVSNNVGIAGLVRYSRGTIHIENALRATRMADQGKTVALELGGFSVTGGLKLWF